MWTTQGVTPEALSRTVRDFLSEVRFSEVFRKACCGTIQRK